MTQSAIDASHVLSFFCIGTHLFALARSEHERASTAVVVITDLGLNEGSSNQPEDGRQEEDDGVVHPVEDTSEERNGQPYEGDDDCPYCAEEGVLYAATEGRVEKVAVVVDPSADDTRSTVSENF